LKFHLNLILLSDESPQFISAQGSQEELELYPILDLDAEGELEEDVDT